MFDTNKKGQSFPPFTVEVARYKIHELALAIGDTNPIYHSREAAQVAGYADVPPLPTSSTSWAFWGNPDSFEHLASLGINVMRILHGEEEYEYLTPIQPGDVLTGVVTVADGKSRQSKDGSSMDIVTLETSYTNQDGAEVLKARQTIVVRE
jgi:acyl dehydratase